MMHLKTYISLDTYKPGRSVGIATNYGLDGPGSNPGGDEIFRPSRPTMGPRPTQPPVQWVPESFPGVKSGRDVLLTPHPLLVPWSRNSRAVPLLSLLAVRPVQSLSACTGVQFTFSFLLLNAAQAMAQFVEALRYRPEVRGFDSRLCQWNLFY